VYSIYLGKATLITNKSLLYDSVIPYLFRDDVSTDMHFVILNIPM